MTFSHRVLYTVFLLLPLSLLGCDSQSVGGQNLSDDAASLIDDSPSQQRFAQAARITRSAATSIEAVREVQAAINIRSRQNFDRNVRFDQLLNQRASSKMLGTAFSSQSGAFKSAFSRSESKTQSRNSDFSEIREFLTNRAITIYWPYMSSWDGSTRPTVTFYPGDMDATSNIGYRPVRQTDGRYTFETVSVNDEYARKHPTWIVNPESALDQLNPLAAVNMSDDKSYYLAPFNNSTSKLTDPSTPIYEDPISGSPGGDGSDDDGGTNQPASNMEDIRDADFFRLYIGYIATTKNYDTIFGGGSDFKIVRLGGDVSSDDEVIKDEATISAYLQRDWNGWFRKIYSGLDLGWEKNEKNQKIALYEWDRTEGTKISASISIELPVVNTEISGEVETSIKDDTTIYQNLWPRSGFFAHLENPPVGYLTDCKSYTLGSDHSTYACQKSQDGNPVGPHGGQVIFKAGADVTFSVYVM